MLIRKVDNNTAKSAVKKEDITISEVIRKDISTRLSPFEYSELISDALNHSATVELFKPQPKTNGAAPTKSQSKSSIAKTQSKTNIAISEADDIHNDTAYSALVFVDSWLDDIEIESLVFESFPQVTCVNRDFGKCI